MTKPKDARDVTEAAARITGRRYCAGHNTHVRVEEFQRYKNQRKCDRCVEKGRAFDEKRRLMR